jgi:PEP-CTERM motif
MTTSSLCRALVGLVVLSGMTARAASATTIGFEDLSAGTTLSNQYSGLGITFSPNAFSGPGSSSSGQSWGSNTDMTIVASGGADVGGLGTPLLVSGNLLHSFSGWLAENGDPSFRATFTGGATSFAATFAGVSIPGDVRLLIFNGATLVNTVAGSTMGQFNLSFSSVTPFTSVVIAPGTFNDWVGVDNIQFQLAATTAVPEPTSAALLGTGVLAALLCVRRRRASRA